MKSPGRVFTAEEIYDAWNGMNKRSIPNTIMVHIRPNREKIESCPRERTKILKVGVGRCDTKSKKTG